MQVGKSRVALTTILNAVAVAVTIATAAPVQAAGTRPVTGEALSDDQTFTYRLLDQFPTLDPHRPRSDHVTEYDDRHDAIYLRLLDADAQGAGNEDMAREILGIDPASYRGKAPAGGWWPTTDRMKNSSIE